MWNPVDPEIVESPHPFWAWLRREDPVHAVAGAGYFLVSRYDDIVAVCRDPETYSSELRAIVQRDEAGRARLLKTQLVGQPQARVLGVADGETHARHRRVVGRTFSPSRMERLSRLALDIAQRCVERTAGAKGFDVVESIAIPLPLEFTTRLLGLPLEDQPALQAFTDHALRMAGGSRPRTSSPRARRRASASIATSASASKRRSWSPATTSWATSRGRCRRAGRPSPGSSIGRRKRSSSSSWSAGSRPRWD